MKGRNSFRKGRENSLEPPPQKKMILVDPNQTQIAAAGSRPWRSKANINKAKRSNR